MIALDLKQAIKHSFKLRICTCEWRKNHNNDRKVAKIVIQKVSYLWKYIQIILNI